MLDKIPKSWNGVPIYKYKEIKQYLNSDKKDGISFYTTVIDILYILIDEDIDDYINEVDIDEIFEIYNNLEWLFFEPKGNNNYEIGDYKKIRINRLSVGEIIDLDLFFKEFNNNIERICSILFRKLTIDDFGNELVEPYSNNINFEIRNEYFLDINICDVFNVIKEYNNYRHSLDQKFTFVLENDDDFEDSEEENLKIYDNLSESDKKQYDSEIKKEERRKHWSWFSLVYEVAGRDILKMNGIFSMNFEEFLTLMCMKKELRI